MALISVSLLAGDFLHLAGDVEFSCEYADLLHLDIMDGVFVPNISYGFPVTDAIASIATKPLDTHLMIVRPENYVERFAKSGAGMLSFHLNATEKPAEVVSLIHGCGMKAGIAINPDIPVERLFPYLADCEFVLIMSVFAGFGGQKFIEETYRRVESVKKEILRQGADCLIEVDGGVSGKNAGALKSAGADILVAGSAILGAESPIEAVLSMR